MGPAPLPDFNNPKIWKPEKVGGKSTKETKCRNVSSVHCPVKEGFNKNEQHTEKKWENIITSSDMVNIGNL